MSSACLAVASVVDSFGDSTVCRGVGLPPSSWPGVPAAGLIRLALERDSTGATTSTTPSWLIRDMIQGSDARLLRHEDLGTIGRICAYGRTGTPSVK
jgi:hypothetical protein